MGELFRRSSLCNKGDRTIFEAHPEFLLFSDSAVREGRTRLAAMRGRVVGFASTSPAGDALELEDLFVDPQWMRRGVGRALVSDAAAQARKSGVGRLTVSANRHAEAFYQRLGFVVIGEVPLAVGTAFRMSLDVADRGPEDP